MLRRNLPQTLLFDEKRPFFTMTHKYTVTSFLNVYGGALVGECGINIYGWVVRRGNQFHFIAIKKPLTLFTWSLVGEKGSTSF